MFIVCPNCDFKYLVNSADLKPNGRMVECANCSNQWFQDLDNEELYSTVSSTKSNYSHENVNISQDSKNKNEIVKNLPSTVVREEKPSVRNSLIVVIILISIFIAMWLTRSYGINTFVLLDFYIREFLFNLNLIISDLAKIIYNIVN